MAFTVLVAAIALAASGPKIGLALNVKDGGGEEDYLASMRSQIRLGLDGEVINLKWDEYEAQNGKPLIDAAGGAKLMGQDALLTISTIDTVKRRLPADVADKPWTDPALLDRFDTFLTTACGQLGKSVKWISLGNEVNVYLAQHADEVDAYLKFLAHSRDTIHKARPDIKVGVTITCRDAQKAPDLAAKLQDGMDITSFTYYPMDGLTVSDLSKVPGDFDFMAGVAGDRPLVLQEIGYPAATSTGGNEQKQAQFVHDVFTQLDRYGSRVALASYFIQYDFSAALMKAFEGYYGISDRTFLDFLGSLGLQDRNGNPRAAWGAFRDEVMKRKPVS